MSIIDVKNLIDSDIVTNHNQEITAVVLNPILQAIVDLFPEIVGNLDDLTTSDTSNIVNAINSLQDAIDNFENVIYSGIGNPNVVTPVGFDGAIGALYSQKNSGGDSVNLWIYTDVDGIGWVNLTQLSLQVPSSQKVNRNDVVNLPSLLKGQSVVYYTHFTSNIPDPDGWFWLGGYTGIQAGYSTWVIATENTEGGTFAEVGNNYLVINQRKQSSVVYYSSLSPRPVVGQEGILYVDLDSGETFVWDELNSIYVTIGDSILGELISSTIFNDLNGDPVVGGSGLLYVDVTDGNKTYLWDGEQYIPINSTTSGGGGGIQSIQAGSNITIDSTDPNNPIISSTGGGNLTLEQARQNGNVLEGDIIIPPYNDIKIISIDNDQEINLSLDLGYDLDATGGGFIFNNATNTTTLLLNGNRVTVNSTDSDFLGIQGNEEFNKQGDRLAFAQIADVEDAKLNNIDDGDYGVVVEGSVRTQVVIESSLTANVNTSHIFDINNLPADQVLTMTGNTVFSFSNMITATESVVFSFILSGAFAPSWASGATKTANSDDYSQSGNNRVVVHISRGGGTPIIYYSYENLD